MERANLAGFMQLLQKPARLIFLNLLGGLARGFGIAIGLTIVASLFFSIINQAGRAESAGNWPFYR